MKKIAIHEQGLLALFFFLAALFITLTGSLYYSHILLFLPLSIVVLLTAIYGVQPVRWNWLTLVLCLFITNVFVSIFIYSPVYDAGAGYYICYLVAGFLLTSVLPEKRLNDCFRLTVLVFMLLSLWALVQHFANALYLSDSSAPNTIFTTKNTFAAAINFVLLPLTVFYLAQHSSSRIYLVILLLFCALLVSISRGAYIAFACGFIFLTALGYRYLASFSWQRWRRVIAGFVVCIALINFNGAAFLVNTGLGAVYQLSVVLGLAEEAEPPQLRTLNSSKVTSSSSWKDRLYYYEIAWKQIQAEPLSGYGYLNYKYYFHVDKSAALYGQDRYGGFVHNDYLQLWVETGVAGLSLLLIFIALAYFHVFQLVRRASLPAVQSIAIVAIGGTLTAYFVHALVDFVFYPPLLLFLFGAYIGYLNRFIPEQPTLTTRVYRIWRPLAGRKKMVKGIVSVLLLAWLSQPAIAEALWMAGSKKMQQQQYDAALDYFLMAINFADYNADYYFNAGRIYYTSAVNSRNKQHAVEADRLFRTAAERNPFEYHNRFARIRLHRDHPDLLDHPASREEIIDWFEYILHWQPMHEFITLEYINTLHSYGRLEQARTQLQTYLEYYKETEAVTELKEKLGLHIG